MFVAAKKANMPTSNENAILAATSSIIRSLRQKPDVNMAAAATAVKRYGCNIQIYVITRLSARNHIAALQFIFTTIAHARRNHPG
ncbi:hypothetical protein [Neorhizobium sp. JUb45]|uniref:hypothetical protein n=2 Tax=unclassified Neorhizobium TaxID=2629175 RepID=UPI001047170E|nr:hypothetical protein [Neorhizobium sp. JUb45]